MNPEPSRSELLHRIGELEALLAGYETGQVERAFAEEVAERQRAEQASLESEERLRLLMENIPASIAMFDRDMRYMAVSGRWAEHFGGAELMLGKLHYEIFPDCPERWRAAHRRGMAGEIVRAEEDPWQLPDGSGGWARYEVRPWRKADGEIGGIIIFTEDITERKQAEEALRRSERIYRAIGESIDFGVWVCATDGACTYASDSLLKLVGLTLEQFSNFGWGSVLHPDDADRTVVAWKECVRTQGKWDIEHRCRGVDGAWHPVLARGVPVRDGYGQIECWAGIALDISALKRTEESLRASEAKARAAAAELQAIMDAAPAVITVAHDVEARQVGGNRMANELVRQPPRSNLSRAAAVERPRNIRLMQDGVELPEGERPLAKVASSGRALRNYELQVVFEDGASIDLLGNVEPLLDDNGRPRGAIAVYNDITERKRADAELRESEERFRNMADAAPPMIWVSGPDKLCTFFNKVWLDFTGRTLEQELGNGWAENVHPEDLERCMEIYSSSFDARHSFQMEYRLRRTDGEYRWLLDNGVPRIEPGGGFVGYIGSCIDITDLRQARERELQILRAFVERAPMAVIMLDRRMRGVQVSQRWLDDMSMTREYVLGRSHYECFPNLPENWKGLHLRSLAGESLSGHEESYVRPNGNEHCVTWQMAPWGDAGERTGGILISYEDVTQRKRLEDASKAHAQQIRALAARLLTAQEDERRRVSRELHDQICQQLGFLASDISGFAENPPSRESARGLFNALRGRIVRASEEARHIAYKLHPSMLDDLGLVTSLRVLCQEFSAQHLDTELQFSGEAKSTTVPREVASCVYRIAQESLQNTAKHSNAKHVSVGLAAENGVVTLTIVDDGAGFDLEAVKGRGGLGLIGMEERVRLLNGEITIAARDGHGTQITLTIPVPQSTL